MEATARVIPLSGKAQPAKLASAEAASTPTATTNASAEFRALEGVLVMMPDEQLDALGAIFCAGPLRRVMTFEGYLVARGFGYGTEE